MTCIFWSLLPVRSTERRYKSCFKIFNTRAITRLVLGRFFPIFSNVNRVLFYSSVFQVEVLSIYQAVQWISINGVPFTRNQRVKITVPWKRIFSLKKSVISLLRPNQIDLKSRLNLLHYSRYSVTSSIEYLCNPVTNYLTKSCFHCSILLQNIL